MLKRKIEKELQRFYESSAKKLMFLERDRLNEKMIYKLELNVLK